MSARVATAVKPLSARAQLVQDTVTAFVLAFIAPLTACFVGFGLVVVALR